jgi:hypothetical protein
MYQLIEQHYNEIINSIEKNHIADYQVLLNYGGSFYDEQFQSSYKKFFRMNAARLTPEFYSQYFKLLNQIKSEGIQSLSEVIVKIQLDSNPTVQASFASKMLHIVDPSIPIYDSLIREFYFYPRPTNKDAEEKINSIVKFHEFLKLEYQRIIEKSSLKKAIEEFDKIFPHSKFKAVKKIDTIIWAFVKYMKSTHPKDRVVQYQEVSNNDHK